MTPRLLPLAIIISGALALSACRNDAPGPDDRSPGPEASANSEAIDPATGQPRNPDAARAGAPTDAAAPGTSAEGAERGALGVLNAINDHEIAAGRQALDKETKGEVADYARMMIEEHTRNRERTLSFSPDSEAAGAQEQRRKAEQELQRLAALDGDAYSRAYAQAMVKGHADALEALDNVLIPAATTPEVAAHLRETREHVAMHLERARTLPGAN